jgi:hypothetical protein
MSVSGGQSGQTTHGTADTQTTISPPTAEQQQLTGLSVQEQEAQLENIRNQQKYQALLQQTATQSGGIFDEAAGAGFKAGAADIDNATRQSLVQMREELAPSLGLRSTDSPILDRGGLVERQGILAKSSLANSLRAQALTNRLSLLTGAGSLGLGLAGISAGSGALGSLTQAQIAGRQVSGNTYEDKRRLFSEGSYNFAGGGG